MHVQQQRRRPNYIVATSDLGGEKGGKNFLIAVAAAARRFNALPTAVIVEEATLPLGKRGGKGKGPILP